MKKIFAGMIAAVMVFSLRMPAFSAETMTGQNNSKGIDAHAKSVYTNPDNLYDAPISNGRAAVTTKNDVVVTISTNGTMPDGLTLNVIEILKEEKASYSWISGIMNSLCDKFTAYNIFFTDKAGNRADVSESVSVSITSPKDYRNIQVYSISPNAKSEKVDAKQTGKHTVFTTNSFHYYVLAEKTSNNGGTTAPANSGNSNTPQTGDNRYKLFGLEFIFLSGLLLAGCGITKRHKNGMTSKHS